MSKPSTYYVVETRFSYGWENCWYEGDEPLIFYSEQEAEQAIVDLIKDVGEAVAVGDMTDGYV